ncbi:hypothetical protein LP419_20450 [Massilia sp. H-1]|nr:hypothetical protein LP419_20450 [Massilia sp. H-1]
MLLLWLGAILDVILMPINKSLWTPSFCVFTTGWALLLFSAFYWLLDANGQPRVQAMAARWSLPFIIYGMNALFIFAFSSLVAKMLMFIPAGEAGSLGSALYAPLLQAQGLRRSTALCFMLSYSTRQCSRSPGVCGARNGSLKFKSRNVFAT